MSSEEMEPSLITATAGIAEAIDKIKDMAEAAKKPVNVSDYFNEPKHITRLALPDGTVTVLEANPLNRVVEVFSLNDFIAMANGKELASDQAIVVYSENAVTLYFDKRNMRESASYFLKYSEEFRFFHERYVGNPLVPVRDLVKAMRLTLHDMGINEKLIERIGQLEANTNAKTTQTAARGRESMGVSITEQIDDTIPLPDLVQRFYLRVYANHDLATRHMLTCLLDGDVSSRTWYLRPTEASFENVKAEALKDIETALREGNIELPIYRADIETSD